MAGLFSSIWGGPALKYTLADDPYIVAWGCWTHYPATSKEDGSPASVFKLSASDPNDLKLVAARNGVKRLKLVRRPGRSALRKTPKKRQQRGAVVLLVLCATAADDCKRAACWPLAYTGTYLDVNEQQRGVRTIREQQRHCSNRHCSNRAVRYGTPSPPVC